jgi:hypothetical protein
MRPSTITTVVAIAVMAIAGCSASRTFQPVVKQPSGAAPPPRHTSEYGFPDQPSVYREDVVAPSLTPQKPNPVPPAAEVSNIKRVGFLTEFGSKVTRPFAKRNGCATNGCSDANHNDTNCCTDDESCGSQNCAEGCTGRTEGCAKRPRGLLYTLFGKRSHRGGSRSCTESCVAGSDRGGCSDESGCGHSNGCGDSGCSSDSGQGGDRQACGEGCGLIRPDDTRRTFDHSPRHPCLADPMSDPVAEPPPPAKPPEAPLPPSPKPPINNTPVESAPIPLPPVTRGAITDTVHPPMWPRLQHLARTARALPQPQPRQYVPTGSRNAILPQVPIDSRQLPEIVPRHTN